MILKCFYGITGTAWIKTAIITKQWTNKEFIDLYYCYEHEAHLDTNLSQCFSREFLKDSDGASIASFRAKTTTSMLPKLCCFNLKFSLTVRLIIFLLTAFLTFFFAIAKPNLG